jgi:hypothetical protein
VNVFHFGVKSSKPSEFKLQFPLFGVTGSKPKPGVNMLFPAGEYLDLKYFEILGQGLLTTNCFTLNPALSINYTILSEEIRDNSLVGK